MPPASRDAQPEHASGRTRLLVAAERLIAEQGPAVSLREVAVAAGQRNTSAVHYHFGSREGLIEAVIDQRQESLERDRLELLARLPSGDRPDLRRLVEALLLPSMRTPYAEGATHYARFVEKVRDQPRFTDVWRENRWPATRLIVRQLHAGLDALPDPLRRLRLRAMFSCAFALLADLEREDPAYAGWPRQELEQHVLDALLGFLLAPVGAHPLSADSAWSGTVAP